MDCVAFYYEELAAKGELYRALKNTFAGAFTPEGELDRVKLGSVVFGNEEELAKLNEIIYAHLPKAAMMRAGRCGEKLVALDAINLLESGLDKLCHYTVAVTAPVETRLARIMARDGIDRERAQKRIAAQKEESYYRLRCDAVLENTGTEQEFGAKAEAFLCRAREEIQRRKANG